jgi:hypothetical protein
MTASWQSAEAGVNALIQDFCHIMDLSMPVETQRARRLLCLFHLDLFPEEFYHKEGGNAELYSTLYCIYAVYH